MVVVNDPFNADESGPYGYAPPAGVDILFAHRVKADDCFIDYYGGANPLFEFNAADAAE